MSAQYTNRSLKSVTLVALVALSVVTATPVALAGGDNNCAGAKVLAARFVAGETKDIIETAVAAGQFKTLAAALEAAGLVDALKGAGPFTVFAPTDEAFAKLPAGTVETLLKPENREKLKAVLLYHVVSGRYAAADVVKLNGKEAQTLQGGKVKVKTKDGVMVDNAKVLATDVMASNGIIHVIDTVLMPRMTESKGMKSKSMR